MFKDTLLVLLDNKIKLVRFVIKIYMTNNSEEEENKSEITDEELAFSEEEKDKIVNRLKEQKNITFEVQSVNIPAEYEKYDNMEWNDTYDKVLLMMNGDPEYQIEQLIKQLEDMDYKTSKYADGEYTQLEWIEIVKERKTIREKIRELEQQINIISTI